jgi:hypothetical protein
MSMHKNPHYQAPELLAALEAHCLPTDFPSQNADGFRLGWSAALRSSKDSYVKNIITLVVWWLATLTLLTILCNSLVRYFK